jgi:ABC-type sugar transport system substrate-binding protein
LSIASQLVLKRRFAWLLLGLAGCAAAPQEPVYRIGFSRCTTSDTWRRAMLAGMQKELCFYLNVQFQVLDAHNDSDLQRRQVQELLRQHVDLLIISPN